MLANGFHAALLNTAAAPVDGKEAFQPAASRFSGADRGSETDEQYRAEMTETDKQRGTVVTSAQEEEKEEK